MLYVLLNTGQAVEHPLDDIDKAAGEQLRSLVAAGAFQIQIARVERGRVFIASRARDLRRSVDGAKRGAGLATSGRSKSPDLGFAHRRRAQC